MLVHGMRRSVVRHRGGLVCSLGAFVVGLAACGDSTSPVALSSLSVSLPVELATAQFAQVLVRQGGVERAAEVPLETGTVTVSVQVGAPAELVANVFVFTPETLPTLWESYRGTTTVVPQPGAATVELALTLEPTRFLTLLPELADGTRYVGALDVRVYDEETGYLHDRPFKTGQPIGLPATRAIELKVAYGEVNEALVVPVVPGSTATPDLRLVLDTIPPPVRPGLTVAPTQASTISFDPSDVEAGLTLECALDATCETASTATFKPCAEQFALPDSRSYRAAMRYREVPSVCTDFVVVRDIVAPSVFVSFDPPYIASASGSLHMTLRADEPLDPGSLGVVKKGDAAASPGLCQGGTLDASAREWRCTIGIAATGWTSGTLELAVTGSDLAKNAFAQAPSVQALPATVFEPFVAAVHTIPAEPSPELDSFLVGFDVVNASTVEDFFNVRVGSVGASVINAAGGAVIPLGDGTGVSVYDNPGESLPRGVAGAPTVTRVWARVTNVRQASAADTGLYTFAFQLAYENGLGAPLAIPHNATVSRRRRPLEWLGEITLGEMAGRVPGTWPLAPLYIGGSEHSGAQPELSVDQAGVLRSSEFGQSSSQMLVALEPGVTRLTVTDAAAPGQPSASTRVEVARGLDVLGLQQRRVVRRTPSGDAFMTVDARLVEPRRLLWDGVRDAVIVVAEAAVQTFVDETSFVLDRPCAADRILSAALSAAQRQGAPLAPSLALLVIKGSATRHCEVDPVSGTVVLDAALPAPVDCTTPTELASDVVTGAYLAMGGGCGFSYEAATGGLVRIAALPLRAQAAAPTAIAIAPLHSVVLTREGAGDSAGASGVGYGASFAPVITASPEYQAVTAVALHPGDGSAIVASYYDSEGAWTYLHRSVDARNLQSASGGSIDLGLNNAWTHLVVDPANAVLYASTGAFNSTSPPAHPPTLYRLEVPGAGGGNVMLTPGATPWPDREAVRAMTLAGPRPVWLSRTVARPGDVVVVRGEGFAGRDPTGAGAGAPRDEVYVAGLRAKVLDASPTHVVFKVPEVLDRWAGGLYDAAVTVRSHGRMSGSTPGGLRVVPTHVVTRASATFLSALSVCSTCVKPVIPLAQAGALTLVPSGSDVVSRFDGYSVTPSSELGFDSPVVVPGSDRVVGWRGAQWVSLRYLMTDPYSYGFSHVARVVPLTVTPTAAGATAVDATGRWLALDATTGLTLSHATELRAATASALARSGTVTYARLAFTQDGAGLAGFEANGTAHYYRPQVATAEQVVTVDASGCPTASTKKLLGAWASPADLGELWAIVDYENAGVHTVVQHVLRDDGTAVRQSCAASWPIRADIVDAASLAPQGSFIALSGQRIAGAPAVWVWLVSPQDPGRVGTSTLVDANSGLAGALGFDPYGGLLVTAGTSTADSVSIAELLP